MKLIVGLGNPGEKYEHTRHNLGFMVIDRFLKDAESVKDTVWQQNDKFKSDSVDILWQPKHGTGEKVLLAKPKTYMNNSGMSVQLIAAFYKITSEDIWIIHDELDLPFGNMKIRFGGSSAGNRGVDSVIETLGTDKFWRFRMGIGKARNHEELAKHTVKNAEDYVLSSFLREDHGKLRELLKRGSKAISAALEKGLDSAMNQYNSK